MDITPEKQNLQQVFANKIYHIDFYQRQYKWTTEPVEKLLDDIFFRFNLEYERYKDKKEEIKKIIDKYLWYYLNTYVTNSVDGKLYIVDGQQRLTTLTLILICLYHLGKKDKINAGENIIKSLSQCIATTSIDEKSFVINHEREKNILEKIYQNENNIKTETITGENIVSNYGTIQEYIQKEIQDHNKFIVFVQYLFKRVVLIELSASQTDIPMLFEVINDRGVRLKPYEILKGKLLGQISKDKVEKYNELWDGRIKNIESLRSRQIKGTDSFFEYYLRSKYVADKTDAQEINRENYHRKIFEHNRIKNELKLENSDSVIDFLEGKFSYYSELYIKIWEYRKEYDNDFKHVYFNGLNKMDSQFLLILSACSINDEKQDEKIKEVSYHTDRIYSLLRLFQSYNSNEFNKRIYEISEKIRDKDVEQIKSIFDEEILNILSEKYEREIKNVFEESLFRTTGIELGPTFKHYFFARIEQFLAKETETNMISTFDELMKTRKSKNNYQIEHILAINEENIDDFQNEEEFHIERNKLGALLLLKGRDNASSNNEAYEQKLKTYAGTLLWNQTLTEDFYKSNISFKSFKNKYNLNFESFNQFAKEQVNKRQSLLFEMIKIIWE